MLQRVHDEIMRFAGIYSNQCASWLSEQDKAYPIDFKDAVVVIVGSDCGTTTIYAALNGAVKVIEYEVNNDLVRIEDNLLNALGIRINRQFMGEFKGELYIPNESNRILLADCEGCEAMLKEVDMDAFPRLCIAVHAWIGKEVERLINYMVKRHAMLTYITPDGLEYVLCTGTAPRKRSNVSTRHPPGGL